MNITKSKHLQIFLYEYWSNLINNPRFILKLLGIEKQAIHCDCDKCKDFLYVTKTSIYILNFEVGIAYWWKK